jgi:hypothetical protein
MNAAYPGRLCLNFDAPQQHEKFPQVQTHQSESGSGPGTEKIALLAFYFLTSRVGPNRT